MIEAKFFTVGTYLYKYNLTVLFVSPSKIAHEKFYIYCPPLLLNEIYAHAVTVIGLCALDGHQRSLCLRAHGVLCLYCAMCALIMSRNGNFFVVARFRNYYICRVKKSENHVGVLYFSFIYLQLLIP